MTRTAWPLLSAAQMRALDRHTIETLGIPGEVLMESAGRAVAEAVLRLRSGAPVLALCGPGNNGGDGMVAARHLHQLGVPVRMALVGADPARLRGDPARQWQRACAVGVPATGSDWHAPAGGLLIDALFGTGLDRDVTGPQAESIQRLRDARSAGARVVAVDLPSGLCADSGRVRGIAASADVTVTLALPKRGLALEPARSLAGRVLVARIGIPDEAPDVQPDAHLWTRAGAAAVLPARPADGHKGTFGHVLVVAGSEGKSGAAALAAEAAARVGAGLVTIGCPAGLDDILEVKCTEAMTAPLPEIGGRALAARAEQEILALAQARDAVGLGPGIGRADETLALARAVALQLERPLALDADGLIAFQDDPKALAARRAPTVLTPHPGEAARLLGGHAAEVNEDRPSAARRLAERTGAVVLLKGAGTLVAAPDGRLLANPTGGPALATGGTGDVLLGLVAGLLAQGLGAFEAAGLAAFVHGAAADGWAREHGASGLLAGELLARIPATLAALRALRPGDGADDALLVAFPEP